MHSPAAVRVYCPAVFGLHTALITAYSVKTRKRHISLRVYTSDFLPVERRVIPGFSFIKNERLRTRVGPLVNVG